MKKRRTYLMLIDSLCFATVSVVMLLFMFGINNSDVELLPLALNGISLLATIMLSRTVFLTYRRVWRYAGYNDYIRLVFSDFVAGIVFVVVHIIIHRYFAKYNFDFAFLQILSIVAVNCIACLSMRFLYQLLIAHTSSDLNNQKSKLDIAIIGAGSVGVSLAKELLANKYSRYNPIYFVDTDMSKVGNKILDIPVIEATSDIVDRIKKLPVQEIVIALPKLSSEAKSEKYQLYSKTNLPVKIYDYPLGSSSFTKRTLRDIKIEDLLFRNAIEFDSSTAKSFYAGKTVLITGGGGSIGSELSRQIAKASPKHLIILDIYENNAYEIQQHLIREYGDRLKLTVEIASVRDSKKIDSIIAKHRPNIILHAAAHKHVPLMEDCPDEAIKNNVFGTYKVANAAEKYGVEKFILVSTDKAVNPTNVMGATKRFCEMIIQSKKDSKTDFVAVRFGNVLGSNGSVIPLFRKQIESGGPITITDKRIIRYFMTIPEAAQLVLEAGAMAEKSEIFVLDMGKPVRILDLAENMIRLSGLTPYVDIDIEVIGLRPGEKLYEELLIKSEELDRTSNSLIYIERDKCPTREELEEKILVLRDALETKNYDSIREALMKTVPTFKDPDYVNMKATESEEMQLVGEGTETVPV